MRRYRPALLSPFGRNLIVLIVLISLTAFTAVALSGYLYLFTSDNIQHTVQQGDL